MNDFNFDVMQKKSIASGARHKKASARGSRKCSLPCDNLTPAQIRKLSSEPVTYRLDQPMTWVEFKAMPDDLQRQYIRDLQLRYNANDAALANMFGCVTQTVRLMRMELGIPSLGRGGAGRMSAGQEEAWQTFLGGEEKQVDCGKDDVAQVYSAEADREIRDVLAQIDNLVHERMALDNFTACVTGHYSPEAMMAILGTMPIPEGKCTIKIEVMRV